MTNIYQMRVVENGKKHAVTHCIYEHFIMAVLVLKMHKFTGNITLERRITQNTRRLHLPRVTF